MTQTYLDQRELFAEILKPASRPDPYPLYAQLRKTPIIQQRDGTYVVSTYHEMMTLLHDPRISVDKRNRMHYTETFTSEEKPTNLLPFIELDPPAHDRIRRLIMHQFTPQRIRGMESTITRLINELLDVQRDKPMIDIVADFAYPLPVAIICKLLGVPPEDEPRFSTWSTAIALSADAGDWVMSGDREVIQHARQASTHMEDYFRALIAKRQAQPEDDLLSALVVGDDPAGRLTVEEIAATMQLLLVAGHETTINLISNSTLFFLHHPDILQRVRTTPTLIIPFIEEIVRYDPPVQFRYRTTLADVACAGVTIPKGATVAFLLASGSRDPARFAHADQFDLDRTDNEHFGFGTGMHYCVGAPLARLEGQHALPALIRRLIKPRLAADPPPYRDNAALRGPKHLRVNIERIGS